MKLLRKALCLLGFHRYKNTGSEILRTVKNRTYVRYDYRCMVCGKEKSEIESFPSF